METLHGEESGCDFLNFFNHTSFAEVSWGGRRKTKALVFGSGFPFSQIFLCSSVCTKVLSLLHSLQGQCNHHSPHTPTLLDFYYNCFHF